MKAKLLMTILLTTMCPLSVKGNIIVYSNSFNSLTGLYVNKGASGGSVSIYSGQLKLHGARHTYKGAYASIANSLFVTPYTGILADLPGKISWSFNLSNMDSTRVGANNGFEVHLVSSKLSPNDSDQFSYVFEGGGMVGNRMRLLRSSHTNSPYGNTGGAVIDIPSEEGLAPLPIKGSFRIEFTPSTGLWELYVKYGRSYHDPRKVTTLRGSAIDNTYINDFMAYLTLEGTNDGAVFVDNLTVEVFPEPSAHAGGPYIIYVGDPLILDSSGSTDADDDIVSYMWDLDDDGTFETNAGSQAIFEVTYAYLQSLGLLVNNTYNIYLKVTDSQQQSDVADTTLTISPKPVFVDIKPASCPNPLNVKSKGVLPVAILGTEDVNVIDIVIASIRLADPNVAPIRNSYEDVAAPVFDANDCNCTTDGPDGFLDLTLKFETQRIVEAIGDVNHGDILTLMLTGVLFDETPIEGADCVLIRGKHKSLNKADINKDGVVDTVDFAIFAQNWLQSSNIED